MTSTSKWFVTPYRQAALLVAFTLVLGTGLKANAEDHRYGKGLEGSWRVQVVTYNCETNVAGPPFSAFLSFAEGGTLTGTPSNPAFMPGQRTSDYGIWNRVGAHTYTAVSEAFVLFTTVANPPVPGLPKGKQRVSQAITVHGDQFTSLATTEFFDVNNNLVFSACAKATGQRF